MMKIICNGVDEPTLVWNKQNIEVINHSLFSISYRTLNFESTDDKHETINTYVASLSVNERSRRDLSLIWIVKIIIQIKTS